MKKKQKKLWIVYWSDSSGYTEFVELWSTEHLAQIAAEKYQDSHGGALLYTYEEIELMK
jgi:hypothetical protein